MQQWGLFSVLRNTHPRCCFVASTTSTTNTNPHPHFHYVIDNTSTERERQHGGGRDSDLCRGDGDDGGRSGRGNRDGRMDHAVHTPPPFAVRGTCTEEKSLHDLQPLLPLRLVCHRHPCPLAPIELTDVLPPTRVEGGKIQDVVVGVGERGGCGEVESTIVG